MITISYDIEELKSILFNLSTEFETLTLLKAMAEVTEELIGAMLDDDEKT